MPTAILVPQDAAVFPRKISLPARSNKSWTFGRGQEADVCIYWQKASSIKTLSRVHARVFLQDGVWYLQDWGSKNGSTVNGTLLGSEPAKLSSGDTIGLGGRVAALLATDAVLFHFRVQEDAESAGSRAKPDLRSTNSAELPNPPVERQHPPVEPRWAVSPTEEINRIHAILPQASRDTVLAAWARFEGTVAMSERVGRAVDYLMNPTCDDEPVQSPHQHNRPRHHRHQHHHHHHQHRQHANTHQNHQNHQNHLRGGAPPGDGPPLDLSVEVAFVCGIFTDAEPNYVYGLVERFKDGPQCRNRVTSELTERPYPKRRKTVVKRKVTSGPTQWCLFDVDQYVAAVIAEERKPLDYSDSTKPVSEAYREQALTCLANWFPLVRMAHIRSVLQSSQDHLTPAMHKLQQEQLLHLETSSSTSKPKKKHKRSCKRGGTLMQQRRAPRATLVAPTEDFVREMTFCEKEPEITAKLERLQAARELKLETARKEGLFKECPCCYDDEVLPEDMLPCAADPPHYFCKLCVKRAAAEVIGKSRLVFDCLNSEGAPCLHGFPDTTMKRALAKIVFEKHLMRKQQDELRRADLADLVECPFCSFVICMPNQEDRIFNCLNPECLQQSCRMCREPSHIPLRCDEVEKKEEVEMRTHIERQMTAGLLRTCWKCHASFFKTEGCNHMTCTKCGAEMCYVCREPLKKGKWRDHYGEDKTQCKLYIDTMAYNKKEVSEAGKRATQEFRLLHPEAKDLELRHNPMGKPEKRKKKKKKKKARKRRRQ